MGRRQILEENLVVSVRIEKSMYITLQEIAALETINTGNKITVHDLFRNALRYVYSDNERLRECFRRSRSHIAKRFK